MSKIAVIYWSGTGNTETMANSVLEGIKSSGADAELFTAGEFDVSTAENFDAIAFGCPAMGAETLEESEFQPMWDLVENKIKGKKIGLFGSYGWGDGEWMRNWEESAKNSGAELISESVICNNEPDDETLEKCRNLGKALV